jgi:hypothetical protein
MATSGKFICDGTCAAGTDMSQTAALAGPNGAGQYLFVKVSGSKLAIPCASNSDVAIGVLQNDPLPGAPALIAFAGVSKIVSGAAVTAGAALMSDTSGRAITQTTTNPICGIALETSAAANQIIEMLVLPSIGAPG